MVVPHKNARQTTTCHKLGSGQTAQYISVIITFTGGKEMRSHHVLIPITITVFILTFCLNVSAKQDSTEIQDTSKNKQVVQRYFHEVVDRIGVGDANESEVQGIKAKAAKAIGELFHPEAVLHFPGFVPTPPTSLLQLIEVGGAKSMVTQIYNLIEEGDFVAAYLHHDCTPHVGVMVPRFRVGCLFRSTGEMISWDAMAFFKLKDGKILEEWIVRDDLPWVMGLYGKEFPCDNKYNGPSPVPIPFGRKE